MKPLPDQREHFEQPGTSSEREGGPKVVLVEVLCRRPRHYRRAKVGKALPVARTGVHPHLVSAADQLGDQTLEIGPTCPARGTTVIIAFTPT